MRSCCHFASSLVMISIPSALPRTQGILGRTRGEQSPQISLNSSPSLASGAQWHELTPYRYAFVTYLKSEGANETLQKLNQAELPDFPGRKVTIVRSELNNKLFIGNIPREVSYASL